MQILIKAAIFLALFPSLVIAGEIGFGYNRIASPVKGYSTSVLFRDSIDYIDLEAKYNYGETAGIVAEDNGRFSIGYDPQLTPRLSLWLDEIVGYDKLIGVDFENMLGFGPKVHLTDKLSFSTGILIHYEAYQEAKGRYSHRLKYKSHWLNGVYLYQYAVDDRNDYIIDASLSIRVEIFEKLDVVCEYFNRYRNFGHYRSEGTRTTFNWIY